MSAVRLYLAEYGDEESTRCAGIFSTEEAARAQLEHLKPQIKSAHIVWAYITMALLDVPNCEAERGLIWDAPEVWIDEWNQTWSSGFGEEEK